MIQFITMCLLCVSKSMKKKDLLRHLSQSDEYVHVDILILFVISLNKKGFDQTIPSTFMQFNFNFQHKKI